MGKSAGKWIKTVLFGKKHSKSNLLKNVTPDQKTAPKTPIEDPAGNPPVILDPRQYTESGTDDVELEKGSSGSPCHSIDLLPPNQDVDPQSATTPVPVSDAEIRRQEEAATKAQAAFRGYLARRAFRALKGIIRLQALIRGHLVRRQAVSTLRCMRAIVKFQAVARGRKVRLSYASNQVLRKYDVGELQVAKRGDTGANSFFGSEKLATNAFVRKLLATLPTAMPLSLQYDPAEPNSAWNWLERWSLLRFWEPPTRMKKSVKAKSIRKHGNMQNIDLDAGKSRRTFRKGSAAVNSDAGGLASEIDKPKRNPRKVVTPTELVQEQPQNELERVKRSLRKVSASASVAATGPSEKPEAETEKPQPLEKVETVTPEPEIAISAENPVDPDVVAEKPDILETPPKTAPDDAVFDMPQDDVPVVENHSVENGEKIEMAPTLEDESSCKEELSGKENQKTRKRRSLPAKQEYTENVAQNNSPSLPSYMAATESAKAKLRAQGAAKFGEDGAEYGNVRRHSLPASTNGKLSSLSPRIQKPVHANGKGGSKSNRSLTASRDDKGLQPGWRR